MPRDINQLKTLPERVKSGQYTAEDCQLLETLIQSYRELMNLLRDPRTSRDDLDQHLRSYEKNTASDDAANDRSGSLPQAPEE